MAEEYHAGICTGKIWSSSINFPIGTYAPPCSSNAINDNMGSFGWSMDVMNMEYLKQNRLFCDDDDVYVQDHSTSVWNDLSLIRGDNESCNNNSSRLNYKQQSDMGATNWTLSKHFSEINDLMNMSSCEDNMATANFSGCSNNLFESSATCMVLQTLFEELENETLPTNDSNYDMSYWNDVAAQKPAQLVDTTLEEKPNMRSKTKNELRVLMGKKQHINTTDEEPTTFKRARIETPSHMPTFKVRKEKLGDRVTALQQLVSPFGKTDTASVLHEAIDYIKYLHDQVNVLTTPYMKDIVLDTHDQPRVLKSTNNKESLRSQGLCLVPVSSTYSLANQFW